MRGLSVRATTVILALAFGGCVPDFAKNNQSGIIMEIAGIRSAAGSPGAPVLSDIGLPAVNDDVIVTVNVFRKNTTVTSTSPLEHTYLDRYEVRFFRSDGRNTEGVDVPFRITGPLGNLRFHTPTDVGELQQDVTITLVRHQAKLEPPLRNLAGNFPDNQAGSAPQLPGTGIITAIAEVTIFAQSLNDKGALTAKGQVQVTFADFPNSEAAPTPTP